MMERKLLDGSEAYLLVAESVLHAAYQDFRMSLKTGTVLADSFLASEKT
jgi:hypothetical protein